MKLESLVNEVLLDAEFQKFVAAFTGRGVRTWSTLEEKALLYGLARNPASSGVIVELGSYCGGSAAFFAKGLASKATNARAGRVVCVDPLLGAPPWLALPPSMFTLEELRSNISALHVEEYVDLRIGDSAAIGAIWPAEQIDVLLIDGDHSFEGALRDLECWAPKLRDEGILLFDDIDNIPEMQALDKMIGAMRTLNRLGAVGGMGVYQVCHGGGWRLLEELQGLLVEKRVSRPWFFDCVHAHSLRDSFRRTREWTDQAFDIGYDLGYLGVCETGTYGVFAGTPRPLCQIAQAVHADRGGGDLHIMSNTRLHGRTFRLVVCRPEDAGEACQLLLPGGLLLAWSEVIPSMEQVQQTLEEMRAGGLDGCGHNGGERPLFWGVAEIAALSPSRVIEAHMAVRLPRSMT